MRNVTTERNISTYKLLDALLASSRSLAYQVAYTADELAWFRSSLGGK